MLRVTVAAPPDVRGPDDLARLPAAADLIELRVDLLGLGAADLKDWIAAAARPVLATVRSAAEGGAFRGGAVRAAALLEAAVEAGAAWIDVEDDVLALVPRLGSKARLVHSRHVARADVPDVPAGAVEKRALAGHGPDALDAFCASLRAAPPPGGRAFMPTGPLAALRVLDDRAALLYGSAGSPVVAGQPSLVELLDELRAGEVTPDARLFGLVGEPPARSPSPALHNAVFRHLALDAVHVPLPGLPLDAALALPFQGLSVTAPFKERALARAAEADEAARAAGAANTLVRRPDGRWRALNTDVAALEAAVPRAAAGEQAVVFGAGGYARAALVALARRGHAARVVARDAVRGAALARELGAAFAGGRVVRAPADRVLVNASPAGADGRPVEALDVDLEGLVVLDGPYAEAGRETWLARRSREAGARVVDGLALLLAQAALQTRAFAGGDAPPEVLARALRPAESLVLVGLRGAGKTTVGRAVARRLGRPFVDLDEEVLRRTGRSAARWIERQGLEAFRAQESAALHALVGRAGLVIATGGGVLERRAHVAWLRELGTVVWLEVRPETAASRVSRDASPRPPLGEDADPLAEARRLLAARAPGYGAAAHVRTSGEESVERVVDAVCQAWPPSAARVGESGRRSRET